MQPRSGLGSPHGFHRKPHAHQSPRRRHVALSAAAPAQSGGLVAVGTGGAGDRQAREQADPALGRLRRLPLVPRDGARIVRGRGHRQGDERAVRQHQSRPRGAAGHRPDLHARAASDGRARRLADDHVPDADGRAGMGRHLFSKGFALRAAGFCRRAASRGAAVPRGAGQDRAEPGGAPGAVGRKGAAAGQGDHRPQGARRRRQADRQRLRHGRWRPGRGAQVSAADDPRIPVAGGPAHGRPAVLRDGRAQPGAHGRGRHLRPSRRRLLALFGRCRVAGAAFREDALRQRPAPGAVGAGLAAQRRRPVRRARARDGGLAAARDGDRGGGVFRISRRGFRGRRGQVLRLVAGRDRSRSGAGCRRFCSAI